jgi:peptidoglycan-associated lipoprotein
MLQRNHSVLALALVAVTLAACSRKQAPQQPTAVPTSDTGVTTTAPTTPPEVPTSTSAPSNTAEVARLRAALTAMVFFDYDQSSIRDDSKSVLDQKIVVLRNNPGVALRIEGHADERGSVEYNLALSLRRANAIKDYLTNFGLDGSRFEVAAMGEERPLESGTSEAAYARNRRGEFYITRGGDNLVSGR